MSIQHVAAVLDARDERLTGSRKLVLVTLANRTDEKGRCWPSQQLLADECGISIRAIADHLKALEADGFIKRSTQHLGKGNGSRTTYTLHLASIKVAPADIAGAELAPATFVGCTGSTPQVTNHQEPTITEAKASVTSPTLVSLEQITGKSRKPKPPQPAPDLQPALDAYHRIAQRLMTERDTNKPIWPTVKLFTAKRQAALRARIKEHGLEAWGTVLRKAYASPLCTGLKNSWAADFDFLTSPDGFLKTLEGKYDDRTHHARNGGAAGNAAGHGGRPDAFDRLAERLSGGPDGPDAWQHDDPGTADGYVIDVSPARLAG